MSESESPETQPQDSTITELHTRVAVAEREILDWQARQQSLASLFNTLQASYSELQDDYRRLSQSHLEILLAHGSLLREHRALTAPLQPLTARPVSPPSGDCGIEFTEQMECNRHGCPTTPPHRHITPPATPKSPGGGVPPCPDRINDIQGTDPRKNNQRTSCPYLSFGLCVLYPNCKCGEQDKMANSSKNQGSRFQAELDDDFGDPDVNPTRENPNHFKNGRTTPSNGLPPSLDINQGPPVSNTTEKGGAQGNPNPKPITAEEAVDLIQAGHGDRVYLRKAPMDVNNIVGGPNETELAVTRRAHQDAFEQKAADILNEAADNNGTLQQLRDSARIASKFADASGEAGPHVTDPEVVSDCGFQAQDGSDEKVKQVREPTAFEDFVDSLPGTSDETRNTPDKSTEDR